MSLLAQAQTSVTEVTVTVPQMMAIMVSIITMGVATVAYMVKTKSDIIDALHVLELRVTTRGEHDRLAERVQVVEHRTTRLETLTGHEASKITKIPPGRDGGR